MRVLRLKTPESVRAFDGFVCHAHRDPWWNKGEVRKLGMRQGGGYGGGAEGHLTWGLADGASKKMRVRWR